VRSFVAFELARPVADGLTAVGAEVRRLSPAWEGEKWVAPQALHVTLEFLGDQEEETLGALAAILRERLTGLERFSYSLDELRAVPKAGRASMLWAVPAEEPPGARVVAQAVQDAAFALGVPAPGRRFVTHVTMVRARRPRRIDPETLVSAWDAGSWRGREDPGKDPFRNVSVSEVTVFTSKLTRSGPVYDIWDRVPLGRA
jgi:RNA 2',3'-cyclic 3'-phosphodiesterase